MAWIYGRTLADGRTWYYMKESRESGAVNLNTTDRDVAESILEGRRAHAGESKRLDTAEARLDAYLDVRSVSDRPANIEAYRQRIAPLLAAWRDSPMDTWQQRDLVAYIAERDWKPATVANTLGCLRRWLSWCRSRGFVVPDILRGIRAPTIDQDDELPYLDRAELDQLLRTVRTPPPQQRATNDLYPLEVFVGLGGLAGLRKGEIRRAAWADVDFERRTIKVPKTKTHQARTIPLSAQLLEILRRHRAAGGPVFRGARGNEIRALGAACRRAGVRRTSPHGLRRTFCTELVCACQGDLVTAMKITGHRSVAMLMRYVKPDDARKRAAVDRAFG